MNIERIIHVTDPEVGSAPDPQMVGFSTEQSIDESLVSSGINAAGAERRVLAEAPTEEE